MTEPRSVVITGASRGLGLASASYLYRQGWTVVAAMRSVDAGLDSLRRETGAAADDERLIGVRLDLTDPTSVEDAAEAILAAVGAPYGLVHNAGISAAGMVERNANRPLGDNVRYQHLRTGSADAGAVAVDAGSGSRPNCAGVERKRSPRDRPPVHQDVRQAGKWSGHWWTKPVVGALTESGRDVGH